MCSNRKYYSRSTPFNYSLKTTFKNRTKLIMAHFCISFTIYTTDIIGYATWLYISWCLNLIHLFWTSRLCWLVTIKSMHTWRIIYLAFFSFHGNSNLIFKSLEYGLLWIILNWHNYQTSLKLLNKLTECGKNVFYVLVNTTICIHTRYQ